MANVISERRIYKIRTEHCLVYFDNDNNLSIEKTIHTILKNNHTNNNSDLLRSWQLRISNLFNLIHYVTYDLKHALDVNIDNGDYLYAYLPNTNHTLVNSLLSVITEYDDFYYLYMLFKQYQLGHDYGISNRMLGKINSRLLLETRRILEFYYHNKEREDIYKYSKATKGSFNAIIAATNNIHKKMLDNSNDYRNSQGISDKEECVMNKKLNLPGSFESTK